ncbi:MAG: shikimate kinase [Oscillospiraceae bacterium]|jgi:shikimate dehydrogenase
MLHCGLLGETLGHSYSPAIHAQLGSYEYLLYEKPETELDTFLKSGRFDGLNVTIPYKKAVVPYCAELSDFARSIGSVNTLVHRADGTLFGDNTDAYGFASMIRKSGITVTGKKVLVLGSGGASVTVCAVLQSLGAGTVVVISRNGENNYGNLDLHADAEIVVNTTPVGMFPHNGTSPVDLSLFPACKGVLDIVYNPARTSLLLQAEARGIPHLGGLHMLVAQAKRSSELFTGAAIEAVQIDRIEQTLAASMQNIILIGMPGSGKSSIANALAARLQRPIFDSDTEIVSRSGNEIPAIFASAGEAAFRDLESDVLADLGKQSGIILATGGGSVLRASNYPALHQNGTIFWIVRDIDALPTDGRPLSQRNNLHTMFTNRKPKYEAFADYVIDNNGRLDNAVDQILEVLS